jgi:hypothetical protein
MSCSSENNKESENTKGDDVNSLKERIKGLERENDLLESEISAIQRLLWSNFTELLCLILRSHFNNPTILSHPEISFQ